MRLILIAFLFAGAAQARDCEPPEIDHDRITGLRAFSECLVDEIADLKRQEAQLQGKLDDLQKSLASSPGELQNDNGRVARLGGGRLTRASFSLTSRTGEGATDLGIDQDSLEELCATSCTFTLLLTAEPLREATPAPVFAAGPCGFHYNAKSGVWARGGSCGGPVSGIDGDGTPTDKPGGEVIVTAGDACILSDSEPSRSLDVETQTLARDRAKGLFLIADATLWKGAEDRFRCELTITR
jgi:hypothetical protein